MLRVHRYSQRLCCRRERPRDASCPSVQPAAVLSQRETTRCFVSIGTASGCAVAERDRAMLRVHRYSQRLCCRRERPRDASCPSVQPAAVMSQRETTRCFVSIGRASGCAVTERDRAMLRVHRYSQRLCCRRDRARAMLRVHVECPSVQPAAVVSQKETTRCFASIGRASSCAVAERQRDALCPSVQPAAVVSQRETARCFASIGTASSCAVAVRPRDALCPSVQLASTLLIPRAVF